MYEVIGHPAWTNSAVDTLNVFELAVESNDTTCRTLVYFNHPSSLRHEGQVHRPTYMQNSVLGEIVETAHVEETASELLCVVW